MLCYFTLRDTDWSFVIDRIEVKCSRKKAAPNKHNLFHKIFLEGLCVSKG